MVTKEIVISEAEIEKRVKELGEEITKDYALKRLVTVGILNGAFVFLADLIREIDLPLELDFIKASSYGTGMSSSGSIKITKDIEINIANRDVLIVEDLLDTGLTVAAIKEHLLRLEPRSLRICALIDKKERREIDIPIDYVGFSIKQGFLVGYGLDHAGKHRQHKDVYRLQE